MLVHLVLEGVADGSLGVGLDVVGAGNRLLQSGAVRGPAPLRQRVVSVDGAPVRSGAGRTVEVDGALGTRSLGEGDVVVVPGIMGATEGELEVLLTRPDVARAAELLARLHGKGVLLAASCSATFVLGLAGVLQGQAATTTWWLVAPFARRFPEVQVDSDRMVVEGEGVLTAGSAFAHADLMLAIMTSVASASLAHMVARYLVLDRRPSQSRYMVIEHLRRQDPTLRALERFIVANVDRQLSLDELAHAVAASPRTLARRVQAGLGMTPLELVQRIRVQHAAHLLRTTREPVEAIAARVGYADPAAFRRVFRRYAGESPRRRRETAAS